MHTYILDTNVLLYDPEALDNFTEGELLLPLEVIEEIDHFKRDPSETGRNARQVAQYIDSLRRHGSLRDGVPVGTGCRLRVVCGKSLTGAESRGGAAGALLRLALELREKLGGDHVTLVSKNVNVRVKADALGVAARDYEPRVVRDTDNIRGWHRLELGEAEIFALKNGNSLDFSGRGYAPNEYVFACQPGQARNAVCARLDFEGRLLWGLADSTRSVCGIRGLNIEQTFTLDALLDPQIPLVTLAGKAGTGKTLLAMAAGLQQIFGEHRYTKLLIFRPTMAVSRDLGFLPGDLSEKMKPWMQPVYDALEYIRSQDRKSALRVLPSDVANSPEISVEPLTYIRGRSIPNQYIIIDEAQNLTPLEVKTVITRVGSGSKIVLTGDPAQIDNPYVDYRSNGLTCLVDRFLSSPLSAHVTLVKGERSELAEVAATLL